MGPRNCKVTYERVEPRGHHSFCCTRSRILCRGQSRNEAVERILAALSPPSASIAHSFQTAPALVGKHKKCSNGTDESRSGRVTEMFARDRRVRTFELHGRDIERFFVFFLL